MHDGMSESQSTGYGESPDTADSNDNLIDGRTGDNAGDRGAQDTTLTTDDDAQRDASVVRGGNDAS
jgi:hypothetical protein